MNNLTTIILCIAMIFVMAVTGYSVYKNPYGHRAIIVNAGCTEVKGE